MIGGHWSTFAFCIVWVYFCGWLLGRDMYKK